MSPSPTGRLVGADLVFLRTIAAPVSEVWSALSESDRLDAWIGRFEGDPASGEVDEGWHLRAQLSDDAGATRLVFTHVDVAPGVAEMIGPGWDYYLDRLVAAVTGGDVNAVDWARTTTPPWARTTASSELERVPSQDCARLSP